MAEGLLKKYDTFVFDWDGTLNNSIRVFSQKFDPYWKYKKVKQGKLNLNRKPGRAEMSKVLIRRKASGIEQRVLVPIADISLFFIRPRLYDGAADVLQELNKRKKKIALFTNGATYRVMKELRHLEIEDYFEIIVSAQDLKSLKPNPLGLLVAMKALKAKRNKVLYIGDMIDDIVMARYANVDSCAIAQGFDKYEDLKDANPKYIFKSIGQFRKSLK